MALNFKSTNLTVTLSKEFETFTGFLVTRSTTYFEGKEVLMLLKFGYLLKCHKHDMSDHSECISSSSDRARARCFGVNMKLPIVNFKST
jgi:hypothetical protein